MNRQEKLVVGMALVVLLLSVFANYQKEKAVRERNEAREETRVIAALYNGVLIGRGCEIPE
jgi:hypothetical protein